MITSIFLNFILIIFPLLTYFLYMVCSKTNSEKEDYLFLDLAIFSEFYLCSKFGINNEFSVFLINIPFIMSIYKKRLPISLLLTFFIPAYISNIYEISLNVCLIEYILIFLLGYLTKLKIKNHFFVIDILFAMLLVIFIDNRIINYSNIFIILIFFLLMYLVFYVVLLICDRLENLVKVYRSLREIAKEKRLYESLFKITHEIKNPLAVCKGYLEMLDLKDENKADKYIGVINQEIDRTLELLKDFSNVSKTINIEKSVMDISLLVEDVCDEVSFIFNKDIKFDYDVEDEETLINGDYTRLKQVLINILKNAKESIDKNGKVNLSARQNKNNYVIIVKDNGIGMSKEVCEKIGTAFFTTKKNGTGLGVCFSREIIEKHSGLINYSSTPNKGTVVKITLPINKTSIV